MTTAVIKLGGDVLEDPARGEVARGVARGREAAGGARISRVGAGELASPEPIAGGLGPSQGLRLLLVHGGGAQVTALSGRLGVETKMVGGRRITDAPTLEVLEMVVAGRLNVELCAALRGLGVRAVGLHAGSGVLRARKRPPRVISGGGPDPIDFGLVGDVVGIDRPLLDALWAAGYLPVVSCLGLSEEGQVLNLNADLAASQMAAALEADTLVAVTAVGGVRRDPKDPATRLATLTVAEGRAAIASGVVTGGMIPKLEEAFTAIAAGVRSVQVVGATEIAEALTTPGTVGSYITADR
jgi:acetylglutamate kinase